MAHQSEQIKMNTSAVAISVVGFVSGLVICFINIIILKNYMKKKNDMTLFYYRFAIDVILGPVLASYLLKKNDMTLFYYRFTIDVILGALLASYLLLIVLYIFFANQLSEYLNFSFYLLLSASNVTACRSIIVLAVAIERMVATYAPIFFHNYRQHFPTIIILILAVIFGLTEDVVLYGFCDFHLSIPKNCVAFGCAINYCFLNYWTFHKATIFASICIFSLLLCVKLFIMRTGRVELSRVNRLALIEAAIVVMFDFLPNLIAAQTSTTQFFSFQNIGPYGTVAKLFGCAIEAFLVFRTMRKGKESKFSENSRSSNRHLKQNITKV
ncbi:unnamed protein product [Caenorhabditis nigoni]